MDMDRVEGAGGQIENCLKDVAGKVAGGAKLRADGKAEQAAGTLPNAAGSARDGVRGTTGR